MEYHAGKRTGVSVTESAGFVSLIESAGFTTRLSL